MDQVINASKQNEESRNVSDIDLLQAVEDIVSDEKNSIPGNDINISPFSFSSDNDDSISIIQTSPPIKRTPEIINLTDDSASEIVHWENSKRKRQSLKSNRRRKRSHSLRHRETRGVYRGSSTSSKKNSKHTSRHRHPSFSKSGQDSLDVGVSDEVMIDKKPLPGSFGELLLKNHTRRFVENLGVKPNEASVTSVNCEDSIGSDEEELELKRLALQSVVKNLDQGLSKAKISHIENYSCFDDTPKASHNDSHSEEANKEPVDMELCDSEPEYSSLPENNVEVKEVGDNFNIPVEWAYMLPPPAPAHHSNDINNFETFSKEQNLCKQTMELSYGTMNSYSNNTEHDENSSSQCYGLDSVPPCTAPPPYQPLFMYNNVNEYSNDVKEPNQGCEFAETLNDVNAFNQEAFMNALTQQKGSFDGNLIKIKIKQTVEKQLSRRARKRKRAQANSLRRKYFKANPINLDENSIEMRSDTHLDADNENDEEENIDLLRLSLLKDLHAKTLKAKIDKESQLISSREKGPDIKEPTSSAVDPIVQPSAVKSVAVTIESISSADNSNEFSKGNCLNSSNRPTIMIGKQVFRLPNPVIINPSEETSEEEEEDCPSSSSQSITCRIESFLKDMRNSRVSTDCSEVNI